MEDTWEARALPILRAIHEARDAGDNLDAAARNAVPDLEERVVKQTIADLTAAGYLDTRIMPGDGDPLLSMHIRGLNPPGLRAIGTWPAEMAADDLLRLLEDRIAHESEPEKRRVLETLLKAATDVGKAVLGDVLSKVLTRGL